MPRKMEKIKDLAEKIEDVRVKGVIKSLIKADCLTDFALRDMIEYIVEMEQWTGSNS